MRLKTLTGIQARVMRSNGANVPKLNRNIQRRTEGFLYWRSILPYESFFDKRSGWYD